MPRFTVEEFSESIVGNIVDRGVRLVDSETDQYATFGSMGPEIRDIVFNYALNPKNDKRLINTVFNAGHWLDLKTEIARTEAPPDRSKIEKIAAYCLRTQGRRWTGGSYCGTINRTEKGHAKCQDPKTGEIYGERQWEVNHPSSNSHIHGDEDKFECPLIIPENMAPDEHALITYLVQLGIGKDYFSEVYDYTTWELRDDCLINFGTIINVGSEAAPICSAYHTSHCIGLQGIDEHDLIMKVKSAFHTDPDCNPNGVIDSVSETEFYDSKKAINRISLGDHHIDRTYILGGKVIQLINRATGCGLEIGIKDKETKKVTVWTNELGDLDDVLNRQHVAIELIKGNHSASMSIMNRDGYKGPQGFKQIPQELRQRVLMPGESLNYRHVYRPIKPKG